MEVYYRILDSDSESYSEIEREIDGIEINDILYDSDSDSDSD